MSDATIPQATDPAITIRGVGAHEMAEVRALFLEYADWLKVDLCFQGFEQELADLPGCYSPPAGGIWFAEAASALAGCVALRPLDVGRCEMKRLWVREAFRGRSLGRDLVMTVLAAARAKGYERICLDTLGQMDAARALYNSLGFQEIPAYYDNPLEDVRYLELELTA